MEKSGGSSLIPRKTLDGWPRGIGFDNGFHLIGTPLGSGLARKAALLFIPHQNCSLPRRGTRILITPVLAAAIGAKERGLDALALGYDRRIRLGRLDIRLLPAGLGPGTSQLEVSFKNRKIVFCGGVRLSRPLIGSAARVEPCDLLVLDTEPAEPKPPSTRRVSAKLVEWVVAMRTGGQVPVLVCASPGAAVEAAWALRDAESELRCCRPVFEMLRRLSHQIQGIPLCRRLEQQWPSQGMVLHLVRLWTGSRWAGERDHPTAYVGPGRSTPPWADAAFRLGEGEDRPGLVSYVKQLGARQVALGMPGDGAFTKLLEKADVRVFQVHQPTQVPLPF